ncbi:MAG: L-2-hydroxyglutarate oxidase [Candidatus Thioglobus sp.]|jgi:L-2-hydroxyglutarate oxidase LhgO
MSITEKEKDFIIIGGGIVGLVLAYKIKIKFPQKTVLVIEKEKNSVSHGTGRNSGVIHSGIYYSPETLKAKYCVSGSKQLKEYVQSRNLWIDQCGKILLPTSKRSLQSLHLLMERAKSNGVEAHVLSGDQLCAMEPNCNPVYDIGIHVPFTSVVDPKEVANSILDDVIKLGGDVLYSSEVTKVDATNGYVQTPFMRYRGEVIINSAGLHADKIAGLSGFSSHYSFLPFKGKYWRFASKYKMQKLVYPIPNLDLPFLGVHTVHNKKGHVYVGPSSTPVFGRENYAGWSGLEIKEFMSLTFSFFKKILFNVNGLRDLAFRELGLLLPGGIYRESRSLVKNTNGVKLSIASEKVGIRSQIFDDQNKHLVSDFVIKRQGRIVHILNAISPAFTASFGLADMIIDEYLD